jgi:hypothetical protein
VQAAEAALDTWGDITFNYESTDTSDFVPTPALPELDIRGADNQEHTMRITQGSLLLPARPHRHADFRRSSTA